MAGFWLDYLSEKAEAPRTITRVIALHEVLALYPEWCNGAHGNRNVEDVVG